MGSVKCISLPKSQKSAYDCKNGHRIMGLQHDYVTIMNTNIHGFFIKEYCLPLKWKNFINALFLINIRTLGFTFRKV